MPVRYRRRMIALALLLLPTAAEAMPPPDEEVVVTARGPKCSLAIADRVIKDREFRARVREWRAGTPVRVVVGAGASYRCMAQIAFRLNRYGVTRIVFDTPGGR